jgi:hypothetical protein
VHERDGDCVAGNAARPSQIKGADGD